jgi:hypothetical protein
VSPVLHAAVLVVACAVGAAIGEIEWRLRSVRGHGENSDMRRRASTKPRDELMDAISAAAAAGDVVEVERLSAQARRELEDRRRHATPLPDLEPEIDEIVLELRRKIEICEARGDEPGAQAALERLTAFEQRVGRA